MFISVFNGIQEDVLVQEPLGELFIYSFILTEKEAHGNNKTPHNVHHTTRPNSGLQRIREVSLTMQFGRPNGGDKRWALTSYKWDYKSYKYHGNPQPSFLGV